MNFSSSFFYKIKMNTWPEFWFRLVTLPIDCCTSAKSNSLDITLLSITCIFNYLMHYRSIITWFNPFNERLRNSEIVEEMLKRNFNNNFFSPFQSALTFLLSIRQFFRFMEICLPNFRYSSEFANLTLNE